jgi:hypothetical protein
LNGAAVDDLARGAKEITIGWRRRLSIATGNPPAMPRRRRLAVPVEHSYPENVQLQEHEHGRREGTSKFGSAVTGHGALFYWEMGEKMIKIDNTIPGMALWKGSWKHEPHDQR